MKLVEAKGLRVLDFDIENRPITYGGMDFTFADVTAIAASFEGQKKIHSWFLGEVSQEEMLLGFLKLFNQADIVTGHYIRGHDLKHINGALIEHGLPGLDRNKLVSDTKTDLIPLKGISASQESLSDTLHIEVAKYHMTQKMWRSGNRLEPQGIVEVKKRVRGDIRQHKMLRQALIEKGYLAPPAPWRRPR